MPIEIDLSQFCFQSHDIDILASAIKREKYHCFDLILPKDVFVQGNLDPLKACENIVSLSTVESFSADNVVGESSVKMSRKRAFSAYTLEFLLRKQGVITYSMRSSVLLGMMGTFPGSEALSTLRQHPSETTKNVVGLIFEM